MRSDSVSLAGACTRTAVTGGSSLRRSCTCEGVGERTPLDDVELLGIRMPFPALLLAAVAASNVLLASLLWPTLVAESFDRDFARVTMPARWAAPAAMSAMSAAT